MFVQISRANLGIVSVTEFEWSIGLIRGTYEVFILLLTTQRAHEGAHTAALVHVLDGLTILPRR